MQEVEVIINSDGKSCTTTNPFGNKRPNTSRYWDVQQYDEAEQQRKTYEIANHDKLESLCECVYGGYECVYPKCLNYPPGKICQARIENGKAIIL